MSYHAHTKQKSVPWPLCVCVALVCVSVNSFLLGAMKRHIRAAYWFLPLPDMAVWSFLVIFANSCFIPSIVRCRFGLRRNPTKVGSSLSFTFVLITFCRNETAIFNFPLVRHWKSSLLATEWPPFFIGTALCQVNFRPNNRRYKSPAVESFFVPRNARAFQITDSEKYDFPLSRMAFTFCNRPAAIPTTFQLSNQLGLTFRPSHHFHSSHLWYMNIYFDIKID